MTAVDITKYVIGKARVGYRAIGVLTPYTIVPVLGDVTIRINDGAEVFDPSLELDVGGPIQGFQYAARVGGASATFSIAELDATNLGILIPGGTSTTSATTAAGTPLSTTLTAASLVGDTSITVAGTTNATVGDYIKIDTTTNTEYRRITAITGSVISFFEPLAIAHASGVAVTETVGDGRTTFAPPAQGRVPAASYKEWAITWPRPDTSPGELVIFRGLAALDNANELTTGARTMGRVETTITGYRDPANIESAAYALIQ